MAQTYELISHDTPRNERLQSPRRCCRWNSPATLPHCHFDKFASSVIENIELDVNAAKGKSTRTTACEATANRYGGVENHGFYLLKYQVQYNQKQAVSQINKGTFIQVQLKLASVR